MDKKETFHTSPEYTDMNLDDSGFKELAKYQYYQRKAERWVKNAGVSPPPFYKQQRKSSGKGSIVWPILKIVLIFGGVFFLLWLLGQMMLSINTGIP